MTIKTVYQTSDGEVFDDAHEATLHQHKVDSWSKIVDKFGIYGSLKIDYLEDFLAMIAFYEGSK